MSRIKREFFLLLHDLPILVPVAGTSRALVALICGLAGLVSAVESPPHIQQGVSPLLLLERSIATASETPEFLSLWQGADGELLLRDQQQPQVPGDASGGPVSPVPSFAGQEDDERPGEVWEQHVRPPYHTAGTHKPREHQHQQGYGTAEEVGAAFHADGSGSSPKPTVKEGTPGAPSGPQDLAAAAEAVTAAAGTAQMRQPVEVGGRYPLDSGHPPTGQAPAPQRRLKPMRTLAYGNIHQTAYYFAGKSLLVS